MKKLLFLTLAVTFLGNTTDALQLENPHVENLKLLDSKMPKALGPNGTLIEPNWVLTCKSFGEIKSVTFNGKVYDVDQWISYDTSNEAQLYPIKERDLMLLHLKESVLDVEPIPYPSIGPRRPGLDRYTYNDFLLNDVRRSLDGTVLGMVASGSSKEISESQDQLNFDISRVIGKKSFKPDYLNIYNNKLKPDNYPEKKRLEQQEEILSDLWKIPISNIAGPQKEGSYFTDSGIESTDKGAPVFLSLGQMGSAPSSKDLFLIGIVSGDKDFHGQEIFSLLNFNVIQWLHHTIHSKEALGATMKTILNSYAKVIEEQAFTFGETTDFSSLIKDLEEGYSDLGSFQKKMIHLTKKSHFAIDYQPSLNNILYKEYQEQGLFGYWSPVYQITSRAPCLKHQLIKKDAQPKNQILGLNSDLEKLNLLDENPKNEKPEVDILSIKSFMSYNPLNPKEEWYTPKNISLIFEKIKQNSPKWLIIDLRENNGGSVKNSKHFLKELTGCDLEGFDITKERFTSLIQEIPKLPQQSKDILPIHYSLMADYLSKESPVNPQLVLSGTKLIVLVDKKTESAGECIAQALKEFNLATIVGCKTAGHVLTQSYEPIALGYLARFPVAEYISRTGVYIEGKGMTPNIELSGGTDALKYVMEEIISKQ